MRDGCEMNDVCKVWRIRWCQGGEKALEETAREFGVVLPMGQFCLKHGQAVPICA